MAVYVDTNLYGLINAVDLNDHIDTLGLELDGNVVTRTNMSSGGWDEFIGGLKNGKLTINFHQDFAAAKVNATIFPIFNTVVAFEVRSTSAARSTTNPAFTGSVLISQYAPISGKVGDLGQVSVSWPTTGAVIQQTS